MDATIKDVFNRVASEASFRDQEVCLTDESNKIDVRDEYFREEASAQNDPLAAVEIVGIGTDQDLPPLRPPIIDGVLRQGGKLILTGDAKCGKTFLLIQLAIALAFGEEWCGSLHCAESRVLYVNLELDEADFLHRFRDILNQLGRRDEVSEDRIGTLNARGKANDVKQLVDEIIKRQSIARYNAIIIDPIYKVQTGDENSAQAIGELTRQLDRLAEDGNCTIIYSHHHPKYSQSGAASIDRGAGSGVFGRDADAIVDIMELHSNPEEAEELGRPFRMEFDLRSFKPHPSVDIWFKDGLHKLDSDGALNGRHYTHIGGKKENPSYARQEKLSLIERAIDELMGESNQVAGKDLMSVINDKSSGFYIADCKDRRPVKDSLESSDRFEWTNPTPSSAVIIRKPEIDDE